MLLSGVIVILARKTCMSS